MNNQEISRNSLNRYLYYAHWFSLETIILTYQLPDYQDTGSPELVAYRRIILSVN